MTHDEMIDVLKGLVFGTFDRTTAKERDALDIAISALSENKGEWIDNGTCNYMCSSCKTEWTTSQIKKLCFCPTCGADMRGKAVE